jgi:hypothetical protein
MSVLAMGIVGGRTAAGAPRLEAGSTPQDLLNTIGKYIPTDVTTAYVAVAGSMALVQPPVDGDLKRYVAIAVGALAAFAAWVIAVNKARETSPTINPFKVLFLAWFEVLAAPFAFLVWSAAFPESWFNWGSTFTFLPALVVTAVSIALGGFAVLLNRNR